MGMQGIDKRFSCINAYRERMQSRKTSFKLLIAKLAYKAKAIVSPYFGANQFAFAPVVA